MSRRIDLLRLDYLFSVLLPILAAIYLNRLNPIAHFDIIIGFALLAITGNTWNDVVDMKDTREKETIERTKGYHPKDIFVIGITPLVLGLFLLSRTCIEYPINAVFLSIIILSVLAYIKYIKPFPVINHALLISSHIVLPYIIILIDARVPIKSIDVVAIVALVFFGLAGQFLHELADRDSITTKISVKQCQRLIWSTSIVSMIAGGLLFLLTLDRNMLLVAFLPLAILYALRSTKKISKNMKDIGLISGNCIMVYLICLIIMQMH